jgi:hypothetical protein
MRDDMLSGAIRQTVEDVSERLRSLRLLQWQRCRVESDEHEKSFQSFLRGEAKEVETTGIRKIIDKKIDEIDTEHLNVIPRSPQITISYEHRIARNWPSSTKEQLDIMMIEARRAYTQKYHVSPDLILVSRENYRRVLPILRAQLKEEGGSQLSDIGKIAIDINLDNHTVVCVGGRITRKLA